jgi:aspartyl-tRNA(Asn)/glutamyl-tRNA(Gln) amidotransferase subunit C
MKITDAEVQHLAELSKLTLSEAEAASLKHDLESILDYVSQLNEVKTEGVQPTYQVFDLENVMRADVPVDYGVTREELLKLAPAVQQEMMAVESVL